MKKISIKQWILLVIAIWGGVWITNLIIENDLVRQAKASMEIETREFRLSKEAIMKSGDLVIQTRTKRDEARKILEEAQEFYSMSVWLKRCIEKRHTQLGQVLKEDCTTDLQRFANWGL